MNSEVIIRIALNVFFFPLCFFVLKGKRTIHFDGMCIHVCMSVCMFVHLGCFGYVKHHYTKISMLYELHTWYLNLEDIEQMIIKSKMTSLSLFLFIESFSFFI